MMAALQPSKSRGDERELEPVKRTAVARPLHHSHAAEGARMSIRSGLRKFRPGASAPVRHLWRAFLVIALIGALGIVLWLML